MKHSQLSVLAVASVLILLSGCASYQAASLNTLSSDAMVSGMPGREEIVVVAKAFNKADCKRYLDRDVIAQGYQPIQLYIENKSDKNYAFSLSRVSLSCASPEEVAEKVHTSTVGRATGYGVGALFLWPLAIPAIVDGVKSSQANDALDIDFSSKAARDQVIQPHAYFNKLLFVPSNEYQPAFTVTLMDQNSNKKALAVRVN